MIHFSQICHSNSTVHYNFIHATAQPIIYLGKTGSYYNATALLRHLQTDEYKFL